MPERQALLEAAERLEKATKELGEKFDAVDLFAHETAAAGQRTRDLTRWVIITQVALVIVTAVLGFTMVRANDANSRSQRSAEYDVASCEAGNDFRRSQLVLWQDNANLIRAGGGKAAAQFADRMLANATNSLKLRDCSQAAHGKVR